MTNPNFGGLEDMKWLCKDVLVTKPGIDSFCNGFLEILHLLGEKSSVVQRFSLTWLKVPRIDFLPRPQHNIFQRWVHCPLSFYTLLLLTFPEVSVVNILLSVPPFPLNLAQDRVSNQGRFFLHLQPPWISRTPDQVWHKATRAPVFRKLRPKKPTWYWDSLYTFKRPKSDGSFHIETETFSIWAVDDCNAPLSVFECDLGLYKRFIEVGFGAAPG